MIIEQYIIDNNLKNESNIVIGLTILHYDKTLTNNQKIDLSFQLFDLHPDCLIIGDLLITCYDDMIESEKKKVWNYIGNYFPNGSISHQEILKSYLQTIILTDDLFFKEVLELLSDNFINIHLLKQLITTYSDLPVEFKEDIIQEIIIKKLDKLVNLKKLEIDNNNYIRAAQIRDIILHLKEELEELKNQKRL